MNPKPLGGGVSLLAFLALALAGVPSVGEEVVSVRAVRPLPGRKVPPGPGWTDSGTAQQAAADEIPAADRRPIAGTRGVATHRATVNMAEVARRELLLGETEQPPVTVHEHMPIPENLPVPPGLPPPLPEPSAEAPLAGVAVMNLSPLPSSSFLALDDNNRAIPPDTHGAVGPNHLMVTLNTQVRIQQKNGNPILTTSLSSFWGDAGGLSGVFDPRVLYEPYSGRWIAVACDDKQVSSSALLVGVSQTSDPTGNWYLYRLDADPADLLWADFPSVGFNRDWIVVQVNMYEHCGESSCSDTIDNDGDGKTDESGPFNRSQIYAFDRRDLHVGAPARFTFFSQSSIGGTQVPAATYDSSLPEAFLLQNWNSSFQGSGFLRLYRISGPLGSETLTPIAFPSTPNPWDFGPPGDADFAPQLGSVRKIDTGDPRMHSVVYRNGTIWGAQMVYLPAGGAPTRTAVQWWQLTTDGSVLQRGRIDDPSGGSFVAYPSIAVNRNNDALIGYSRFSAAQYASGNYAFRAAGDPPGTVQSDVALKAGEAPYYKVFRDQNRWGDYSATVVDPINDVDMWTIQEYAATPQAGSDRWGTWWGRIVPTSAGPAQCVPGASNLCLAANRFRVAVSWRAVTQGTSGVGNAVALTSDTGYFWFFNSANVELLIKVLDARAINGKFWVFYGALSDVEYTITVTDTATGAVKIYLNPQGRLASVADTSAF